MTILEALRSTTERIKEWAESTFIKGADITADDFGVYVQDNEPTDAIDGDIWIDTANDPEQAGGIDSATVDLKIANHGTDVNSHNDIRAALQSKLDVSDIINNLTTNTDNQPLSAAQGVELKRLIDNHEETDPTVPAWAKAASKPTYTKAEVGLGNVANELQYSSSNPPPYPITSVNGKTGAVSVSELPSVTASDNGKVLMVVNGSWQVVSIGLSADANGVVSVYGGA